MTPQEFQTRDLSIVEQTLPAFMMVLMMEQCQQAGYELRADVMHKLNLATIAPLMKCDQLSVARLARRVDDTARTLLGDLSPDDPRHGLYCCAMFALTLVDEGRLLDVKNMAVLVAMLLIDDARHDQPDEAGNEAVWRCEETKWKHEAKKMVSKSMLMGLYLPKAQQLIA